MSRNLCCLLLVLLAAPAASSTLDLAAYETLTRHELGPEVPVPSVGIEWEVDVSRWRLDSGTVRLQPGPGESPAGLYFSGRGKVTIPVPDRVELRQLRRFLRDPAVEELELTFERMVLRASGGPPFASFGASPADGEREAIYDERHEHALELRRLDIDARILAALGDPEGFYWRAEIETSEHGWVTVTFDSSRSEELTVLQFNRKHSYVESWLSLDREEDRREDGRPSGRERPPLDIQHVELDGDLSETDSQAPRRLAGKFEARLDVEILREGLTAVPLYLRSRAKVEKVVDTAGEELDFVRDHIGSRSSTIDKKVYASDLIVLTGRSLAAGERYSLTVYYELSLPRYASGRSWYPGLLDFNGLKDRHTARFTFTTDDRYDLQSMGSLVESREEGDRKISVWEIDRPAKMATFAMQKTGYRKELEFEGLPRIVTVGDLSDGRRVLNEERIDDVAGDTVNATNFLQNLLASPLPDEQFFATLIPAGHGQAFPGFLHLSELTTAVDSAAAVEGFRAHEVGHQWWGHIIGWNSYRDQWLSEGFAEYTALMFVETSMDDGARQFQKAITAYNNEVRGSLEAAFSSFARPGYALLSARGAERMGPIGHGFRAGVGEAPTAYSTLAYYKGAMVLHMLRTMTRLMTKSDDAFIATLRDFVATNAGRYASTEDFQAALERNVPADWSWFFDQWVYGAEIPTYRWRHEIVRQEGQTVLRVEVEQEDVAPGFRMGIPLEVDFGKDRKGELLLFVDQPRKTFEFPLPSRPKKVTFNAGDAVIADVKKL